MELCKKIYSIITNKIKQHFLSNLKLNSKYKKRSIDIKEKLYSIFTILLNKNMKRKQKLNHLRKWHDKINQNTRESIETSYSNSKKDTNNSIKDQQQNNIEDESGLKHPPKLKVKKTTVIRKKIINPKDLVQYYLLEYITYKYYFSRWKKWTIAKRYCVSGYAPRRMKFRIGIKAIQCKINQTKLDCLNYLFEYIMNNYPPKECVYNTVTVKFNNSNYTLKKLKENKARKMIKFLAKISFFIRISLYVKNIIISSIHKMILNKCEKNNDMIKKVYNNTLYKLFIGFYKMKKLNFYFSLNNLVSLIRKKGMLKYFILKKSNVSWMSNTDKKNVFQYWRIASTFNYINSQFNKKLFDRKYTKLLANIENELYLSNIPLINTHIKKGYFDKADHSVRFSFGYQSIYI